MRGITSKFIITIIVLFTALSVFWFFKTSGIKKRALSTISASGGQISAASVSVSGFPMKQKLKVEDLKIQISAPSKIPSGIFPGDKYQITIAKLEASTSIFSGDFKVDVIEGVTFQDQGGAVNSVEFNQPPTSNFLISGGELVKFSYKDSGYKVVDTAKNTLFENGNSSINFESAVVGDQYHNKVKADFKDVGSFNFGDMPNSSALDTKNSTAPDAAQANATAEQAAPTTETAKPTQSEGGGVAVKKNFVVDLEYTVSKPSQAAAPVPVPNPNTQDTTTSDISLLNEKTVDSISIKNFEISSPLYKINVNGEITSLPKDGAPTYSVSVRIEKLDNVLVYIKKFVNNSNTAPVQDGKVSDVLTPSSDSATSLAANQKPDVDVTSIVKDLSKKNAATNEEIAVFDFRQEQGKDLLINETFFSEISGQAFTGEPSVTKSDTTNTGTDVNAATANPPIPAPTPITTPQVVPIKQN